MRKLTLALFLQRFQVVRTRYNRVRNLREIETFTSNLTWLLWRR